jgi:hypothetical protein
VKVQYTYTVTATDDDGDFLYYSLQSKPEGMLISGNVMTWTPSTGVETSGEVTLIVSDGLLSDKEVFTISVKPNGIHDNETEKITLYPNPVNSVLNIKYHGTIKNIQLISITGICILNERINASETDLNIESLNPGIYLVKIKTNNGILFRRIIKN